MRSSSAPDSEGFGDHPDQYTGDPVWRLCAPGAGAAPWQERAASPIAPARNRRWPGSGRPDVRREYDHQPDAPAASCVAPCAFVAVRDITGRMLLVRRCDTGDWELPGGHVDPGACVPPVIVTLPAQINAATAEQAAEQINAAFTPGVTVVIADLTSTACRDCSAIRHLLRAHRKATARGGHRCDSRSGPAGRSTGSPNSRHPPAARGLPHPPARHKGGLPKPPGDHAPSRWPPPPHYHLSGCLRSWPERDASLLRTSAGKIAFRSARP